MQRATLWFLTSQQPQKFFNRQISVAQNLPQQSWLNAFVVRHSDWKVVRVGVVPHADMTSFSVHDSVTNLLQDFDNFAPGNITRQFAHY
ncbi:MAG: hypothetical protein DFNUSKGM_000233 [Candidatus Fervidibacter sacchari]